MQRLNRTSTLILGLIMACFVYSNVAVAIDLKSILKDITKEKISHIFKQENKKRERTPEERHLSILAKQIIEKDRVPHELKEKWRHKYRKIPKTHSTHRKGRIISNKSLEIPSYSRALIKLRTYCLDSSLPAPGFREKMYIVHISKLLIRKLIPIYERLMNYSALHPEKKLQIQRIAWFMRHLSEGIYVPSFDLVNEDKALLEQIYPGSTGLIEDQKRKILVKRQISKWVDVLADKTIPPEIRGVLRDLSNSGYNVNILPGDLRTANSIASRVLHIINTTKPVGEMEDNSEYTLLSNDIAVKTEHSGGYGSTALIVVNPTPVVKTLDFTEYALQSTRPTQRLGMGGIESAEWEKGKLTLPNKGNAQQPDESQGNCLKSTPPPKDLNFSEEDGKLVKIINDFITNYNKDSPVKGEGKAFVRWGKYFKVDPRLIVAIARQETSLGVQTVYKFNIWNWKNEGRFWDGFASGWDTDVTRLNIKKFGNPPHYDDNGKCGIYMKDGYEDGIFWVTRTLRKDYIDKGINNVDSIGKRYCTSGCNNWEQNVKNFMCAMCGDPTKLFYPSQIQYCRSKEKFAQEIEIKLKWYSDKESLPPPQVSLGLRMTAPHLVDKVENIYFSALYYQYLSVKSLHYAKNFSNDFSNNCNVVKANKYLDKADRYHKLAAGLEKDSQAVLDGAYSTAESIVVYKAARTALGFTAPHLGIVASLIFDTGTLYTDYLLDTSTVPIGEAKKNLIAKAISTVLLHSTGSSEAVGDIVKHGWGSSRVYPVLQKIVGSSEFKDRVLEEFVRLGGDAGDYAAKETIKEVLGKIARITESREMERLENMSSKSENFAPQSEDLLRQPVEEIENLKDNKNKNTEDLLK